MLRDLLVPKLGLTMTEGTLVEWMVKPGETFHADQSLFVIESDKAATEIPAEAAGVLVEASAEPGAVLKVGAVVGRWDDLVPQDGAGTAVAAPAHGRIVATPLARRLAKARGVPLETLTGSGPRGRIRACDLPPEQAPASGAPAPAAPAAPLAPPAGRTGLLRDATPTELAVARRLVSAKQEIPHFYLSIEAEVSRLLQLREQLNAAQSSRRLTLNHFILAAVGRALVQMPQANRVWTPEGILQIERSDVGMAVNTERGLLVPVLRGVGGKTPPEIARDASEAAARAAAGRLGAAEMAGGAITVSNAGMHDVTYMASIINPGQAMILGIGSVRGVMRPDAHDRPETRREMGMVLSADHRVMDGVSALQFLRHVRAALENPLGLLVAP